MSSGDLSRLKGLARNSILPHKEPAVDPREVAMYHAELLQHRKDLESKILESLILLSEYPLVRDLSQHSASNPAPSDLADFKAHVRLFQPSDYDDLIEERNVNGLCGYTLCAKPRRQTGPGGEWKLASNGEIVKRKDLEMWCSKQCARRALFVKVQLNETAAWERVGSPDIQIDVLDDDKSAETEADRTARRLEELKLENQRQATRVSTALAAERGDNATALNMDKVKITLKEKNVKAPVDIVPAIATDAQEDHLLIDGHKTRLPLRLAEKPEA